VLDLGYVEQPECFMSLLKSLIDGSSSTSTSRRKGSKTVDATHPDGQIIILCVSWYTSFKLSLRDLVIMIADRGITLTYTTISAMGPALPASIRDALEPICSSCGWILEDGRDIYKG
jgi:hypothetical protein